MKKALSVFMLASLMALGTVIPAQAAQGVSVFVNGQQLGSMGDWPAAVIINDSTFVPLAEISDILGFYCTWIPESKSIVIGGNDKQITMQIGNVNVIKEDTESGYEENFTIPNAPTIVQSKTFVPVRAVADAFDAMTDWDANTKTVNITTYDDGGYIESGDMSWTFSDAGTLTISGSGEMPFFEEKAPWYYDCINHEGTINIKIENGITSIAAEAFKGINNVHSVDMPFSLESIGAKAFEDCYALSKVTIPYSVTYVGNGAFSNCTSLQEVTIEGSGTSISSDAFSYCVGIKRVNIKKDSPADDTNIYPKGARIIYNNNTKNSATGSQNLGSGTEEIIGENPGEITEENTEVYENTEEVVTDPVYDSGISEGDTF
ncbi:MAG: leucine-rich repeat protein [Firmicutes bacterium]|nr:leucine-rich repeat protein [Bacillota bacterium]